MPINSSSIPALRVARAVKRRRRAEGGGLWGDVGAAMPEAYGAEKPILDPLVSVPKRLLYDLPKEMVEKSQANPLPGLRREDYTDIPGSSQPVDPMVGGSLETAVNMAGIHAPFIKPGTLGASGGKLTRPEEIDRIIEAERNLKGAPHDPATPAGGAQAPEAAGDVGGGLAGPAGRGASLEEAARASARWAGERQPIEGLPVKPQYVEGHGYLQPGPIGKIHDVAEAYMRTHRPEIAYAPPREFRPIDTEHSQAIAKAYDEMKHAPNDPATKAAYEAMIDETAKQYQAIKASGLKIEPIPAGMPDPYAANPRLAAHDVAENNHLWFFPTEGGFGTVNKITSNPLLRKMGEKIGDHEMTANDMFRVVHDYFGHLKEGHGFRAAGEDNAWRSHSAMYSDLARPAMTSETRGQNSWVNYGPHGEKNRTASGVDTVYADQKVGLMPDWTMYDKGQAPPMMYHGSRADYLRPDLSKLGSGQGEMAYGAGYYGSEGEKVAQRYRDMQAERQWTRNGQPVSLLHAYEDMRDSLMLSGFSAGRSEHVADAIGQLMEHGFSPAKIRGMVDREGFEKEFAAALKVAGRYKNVTEPGHLYKWAIEANPNHFLDWDSSWYKQHPHVQERVEKDMLASIDSQKAALQKSIKRLLDNPNNLIGGRVRRDRDLFEAQQRLAVLEEQGVKSLTGKDIYKRSGLPAKDQAEAYTQAAQKLNEKGIPGLRYRNISGGADSGVRNFVIFNPETLRLLRKYGVVGIPAAGVAAADGEDQRARGGRVADRVARRIRKAAGGAFGVYSPAEEAELNPPEPLNFERPSDDSPVRFKTASPLVNITEGDIERGINVGLGATTGPSGRIAGAVGRIADDGGAAMTAARRAKQYAEPELGPTGKRIINMGTENPPRPSVQTVADPYRMMFPGIYRNPKIIAQEAAERVGPEDPALKRLFGVTRGEMREMAQGRVGNEDPRLHLVGKPTGARSAQNIQTPQNDQRLVDILGEAGKHEGLRTADAWYIMDPAYRRMVEMGSNDPVAQYRHFNTMTGMASPGSDVMTEIQRGTGAHWLAKEGRFEDFQKYAGIPEELRNRVKMPGDMRYIGGHPYHRTSQGDPMEKYLEKGFIDSKKPKVPLYVQASGVPETGFQTAGPVGDAHFSRGVGLSDTRKGPSNVGSSFSTSEYQTLQPWWQHDVAGKVGLESVPAQARLWTALGPQTGVESELGAPKLELLAKQIMTAAQRLRISPEKARDLVLSGKAGAGMLGGAVAAPALHDAMSERKSGGSVNAAMDVARAIRRAKGGKVHVGPIVGSTDGRADKVPMEVPDGSYVLTADHCSAMGEGNTLAGFEKLKKMFPKSVAAYKAAKAKGPGQRASGGRVPILAADGEFVICPEDITDRWGKLDEGHRYLDHWQTTERKNHIQTLAKLAPPAQD